MPSTNLTLTPAQLREAHRLALLEPKKPIKLIRKSSVASAINDIPKKATAEVKINGVTLYKAYAAD